MVAKTIDLGRWRSDQFSAIHPAPMHDDTLILRPLRHDDEAAFGAAIEEFRRSEPSWEFALGYERCCDFLEYVDLLDEWSRGIGVPEGFVPATFLVGVVRGRIVGRLSLRHRLNAFLEKIGGHIGYGVVPGCRRKGFATAMLQQSLPLCRSLGIRKVLVTCDVDNVASRRVIEKCGGVLEGLTELPELKVPKRRYWIEVEDHEGATPHPCDDR